MSESAIEIHPKRHSGFSKIILEYQLLMHVSSSKFYQKSFLVVVVYVVRQITQSYPGIQYFAAALSVDCFDYGCACVCSFGRLLL